MPWGAVAAAGVEDLCIRLASNDPKLQSLTLLRFRRCNDSDVEALCRALTANTACSELNLCSHPLSTHASGVLGRMLQDNHALTRVSIGNSAWGDEALAALAAGLQYNTCLQVWDLEHKGLSSAGAGSILAVLRSHPALHALLLSCNEGFGDAGLAALCDGGANVPWRAPLTHLELAGCGLTAEGVSALVVAGGSCLPRLQSLDLSHNSLGSSAAAADGTAAAPAAAHALGQLLSAAPHLRHLRLAHTALGAAGVAGLAQGLADAAAGSLAQLDLSSCGLDDGALLALAAALSGGSNGSGGSHGSHGSDGSSCGGHWTAPSARAGARLQLQSLLLGGNEGITDTGVAALAAVLTGAATAAAGLQQQQQQQPGQQPEPQDQPASHAQQQAQQQQRLGAGLCLDLSQCSIGAEGVQALAGVPGLTQLSLFGCRLGSASGEGFAALQVCLAGGEFGQLRGLNLSCCQLSLQHLQALVDALAPQQQQQQGSAHVACPVLATLEVGGNPGTQSGGFEGAVQQLRAARPGLDVHWRVVDKGDADV